MSSRCVEFRADKPHLHFAFWRQNDGIFTHMTASLSISAALLACSAYIDGLAFHSRDCTCRDGLRMYKISRFLSLSSCPPWPMAAQHYCSRGVEALFRVHGRRQVAMFSISMCVCGMVSSAVPAGTIVGFG